MRKMLMIMICLLFIICVINVFFDEKEINIRIVPNSNSKDDLLIKEEVKNISICYLSEIFDSDYNKYIDNINNTKEEFKKSLNKIINKEIEVNFLNHTLYNKTYNGNVIENSNNLTLLIIIEKGQGDNWWGSIYPEFLLINSDESIKYKSIIVEMLRRKND